MIHSSLHSGTNNKHITSSSSRYISAFIAWKFMYIILIQTLCFSGPCASKGCWTFIPHPFRQVHDNCGSSQQNRLNHKFMYIAPWCAWCKISCIKNETYTKIWPLLVYTRFIISSRPTRHSRYIAFLELSTFLLHVAVFTYMTIVHSVAFFIKLCRL